jgi:hypothetical protein
MVKNRAKAANINTAKEENKTFKKKPEDSFLKYV